MRGELLELRRHFGGRSGDDAQSAFVGGASNSRRMANVLKRRTSAAREHLRIGAGKNGQHLGIAARKGEDLLSRRPILLLFQPRLLCALKDHMRIGAAKAERIDSAIYVLIALRKRLEAGRQANAEFLEGNLRVGILQIGLRRHGPSIKTERRLDESGDARRRFEMTDRRFRRMLGADAFVECA